MSASTESAPAPPRSLLKGALWTGAAIGALLAALTARVVVSGEAELAASTDALKQGQATEAIEHARRAAAWYAPGAPHVGVAYARLEAIARAAEAHSDRDTALFAWRAVRTASLDARWIAAPHARDLAHANDEIARLSATVPRPLGTRTDPPSEVRREALEALSNDESPDVAWVVVLLAGAATWSFGLASLARRAVTPTGRFEWAHARTGALVTGLGVAAYLVALWRA